MALSDQVESSHALKSINLSQCLCHNKGVSQKLTRFTDSIWNTLRTAGLERKDTIYQGLTDILDGDPCVGYHRQCYLSYTSKCHIARFKRQRESLRSEERSEVPPLKRDAREPQTPKAKSCIICKESKYQHSRTFILFMLY